MYGFRVFKIDERRYLTDEETLDFCIIANGDLMMENRIHRATGTLWHVANPDIYKVEYATCTKDKKGQRIFQNDVVLWEDGDSDKAYYRVNYNEEEGRFVQSLIKADFAIDDVDYWYEDDMLVIGSATLNPELLESL